MIANEEPKQTQKIEQFPTEAELPPTIDAEEIESELAVEPAEPTPEKIIPAETRKAPAKFHFPNFKKTTHIPTVKDLITNKIEKIMEEDLQEIYKTLPPIAQQEFKIKGEETATKIRELLKSTHVKIKKIFQLIVEWLKVLPGINQFFLEQEAKIKTDKIIMLNQK